MGVLIGLIYGLSALLTLLVVVIFLLSKKPKMIFNTYPSKDILFTLKFYLAWKLIGYIRSKLYDPTKPKKSMEELEQLKNLGDHPNSYDIISFVAANESGESLVIFMERRRRGILKACVYLYLPNEGLLCLPKMPDMIYFTTDGNHENSEFRGIGLHIFPEQYMRRWRIRYAGPLRNDTTKQLVEVKMDLVFSSTPEFFEYNRDTSLDVISDSIAREAWDSEFLKMLQSADKELEKRTHYEQIGTLNGNIGFDNGRMLILNMNGYKDHNFGSVRSLSDINRYVYMVLFLDDGTTLMVGNVSQPSLLLSSLKVGYICRGQKHYEPITQSNFELYAYGEKGVPPQRANFIISTARETFCVQTEERHSAIKYSGGNWNSKIYNQFVKCNVNGVSGNGVTEFMYRHDGGRPDSVVKDDPDWYRELRSVEDSKDEGDHFGGLEFE